MLKIAIYTSNHGYGHCSRVSALAYEFTRFGIHVSIRTNRPDFLFRQLDPHFSDISCAELDFGVKHGPNLCTDYEATRSQILKLMTNRLELVDREICWLRESAIDLVISDIPWLAVEAASYAGIPVFAISNFDWLYIYSSIFSKDKELRPVINSIHGIYQRCNMAYKLPFSGRNGMQAFPNAIGLGLLARKKENYQDIRKSFSLPDKQPILLSMFGGEGSIDLDLETICQVFKGTVFSSNRDISSPNHIKIAEDDEFLDFVHAADIILTKPGYSSFAEAVQFGKSIIYRERLNYPEEELLIGGLAKYPYKYALPQSKLTKRAWTVLLKGVLLQPKTRLPRIYANRNTDIAAQLLHDYFLIRAQQSKLVSVFDVGSNNLNYCLYDKTNERVLHKTQVSTGLARGFENSQIKADAIRRFKKGFSQLFDFDRQIDSSKYFIASEICRSATNTSALSTWMNDKLGLNLRIISTYEEVKYVRLAVLNPALRSQAVISFDIGGASTEFAWKDPGSKAQGLSLNLGLLSLTQDYTDQDSRIEAIRSGLDSIKAADNRAVVGIGLTVVFLQQIINRDTSFTLGSGEWGRLRKNELQGMISAINNKEFGQITPYMREPANLDILALSCTFCILIMDRFGTSEIMVCPDGISVGFARNLKSG